MCEECLLESDIHSPKRKKRKVKAYCQKSDRRKCIQLWDLSSKQKISDSRLLAHRNICSYLHKSYDIIINLSDYTHSKSTSSDTPDTPNDIIINET